MVTSRDRILTAIDHKESDRVPVCPLVLPQMVNNMSKREWKQLLHQTDVMLLARAGGDIYLGQEAVNRVKTYKSSRVITIEIHTPKGILTGKTKNDRDTSWIIEPFLKDQEDVDKFLSVPYRCSLINGSDYFQWKERVRDEGLVWAALPSAMRFPFGHFGPEQFYLKIAENLNLIEKLTKIAMQRIKEYIEKCCKIGIRLFWMGGSEHCGPGVVNPKIFKRLVVRYDKPLVSLIHKYNGLVYYHIHNNVREILDNVVEIGADIISPLEMPPSGDISLREAKKKIGNRICLMGNLDDMALIARASEEKVRKLAISCIKDAKQGGGYILSGTDATIYRPKWIENFLVMAKAAKEHPYQNK